MLAILIAALRPHQPNFTASDLIACDQAIAATFADARIAHSRISRHRKISPHVWYGASLACGRDRDDKIGVRKRGCRFNIGEIVNAGDC